MEPYNFKKIYYFKSVHCPDWSHKFITLTEGGNSTLLKVKRVGKTPGSGKKQALWIFCQCLPLFHHLFVHPTNSTRISLITREAGRVINIPKLDFKGNISPPPHRCTILSMTAYLITQQSRNNSYLGLKGHPALCRS